VRVSVSNTLRVRDAAVRRCRSAAGGGGGRARRRLLSVRRGDGRHRLSTTCTSPGMPQHRLGILFVHGIGEQPEGSTLLSFGQPLLSWLRRWFARGEDQTQRGSVEVVTSVLAPSKLEVAVPPHAEVQVKLPKQAGEQSWLMAESWWGGDVQAPAFGKVAGWMMTVGAWSILSHITK